MYKNLLAAYKYNDYTKDLLKFYQKDVINSDMNPGTTKMGWDEYVARGTTGFQTLDDVNSYLINNRGYRGENFLESKPADIVAGGCSITFGIGVPDNGVWPAILSEMSQQTVANLGMPGHSVPAICKSIIKYCMNYGNPKTVYCLFPDFFRMLFVQDPDFLTTTREKDRAPVIRLVTANIADNLIYHHEDNMDKLLFDSKDKNRTIGVLENSVTPHQAVLESLNAIYMLESFCKTNNIKLIWSTWCNINKVLLDTLLTLEDFELTQYLPIDDLTYAHYDCNKSISDCKIDHNTEFSNNVCWENGSDYFVRDKERIDYYHSHPGIHFQYHIANFFNQQFE
jgi:hypothetical protein